MSYPVSLDIAGKLCVVVGGGGVAQRRAGRLLRAGARVRIVSPDVTPGIGEFVQSGQLEWHNSLYDASHIEGAFLVIAATSSPAVNAAVGSDAHAVGALACRVDSAEGNDFSLPATIERGDLCIAVSTRGASPTLASAIRRRLERDYGEEWAVWTQLFGRLRETLQAVPSESERIAAAERVLADRSVADAVRAGEMEQAVSEAKQCI